MIGMSFTAPLILLLLFGLLLFGWRLLKLYREQIAQVLAVGNAGWNRVILRGKNGRFAQQILWLVGMGCLLVALARPQWGSDVTLVESRGVQLLVVLDLSQSMMVADGSGSRLAQAKEVVETAVSALTPQDEVGLMVFAGERQLWLPLTTVHAQFGGMLAQAHPQQIAQQGTLLAQAIEAGRRAFPLPHNGQSVMLILTDGEDHGDDVQQAAQAAAENDVILLTVGLGSSEGGTVPLPDNEPGAKLDADGQPVISKLDEAGLRMVAEVGNGRYFHASEAIERLPSVLNNIRVQHTGLEKVVRPVERYQLFLLAAVMLFGLAAGVPNLNTMQQQPIRANWAFLLIGFMSVGLLLTACRAPDDAALIAEGNAAFDQGLYEQALLAYQQVGSLGEETATSTLLSTGVSQYNLANTHYRMEHYSDAGAELQSIKLDVDPELGINTFFNLGNAYFQQAQYEAAIAAYQSVLRQSPNDVDAKHNLELALQQLSSESGASPEPSELESGGEANGEGEPTEGLLGDGDEGGMETAVTTQTAEELLSSAVESAITLPLSHSQNTNSSLSSQHAKDW